MSAKASNGPPLYLGIELATDQFRACVLDESLELVGVECVDFDTELSDYQTTGGIFTSPGEAYTTPVEMWIHGLDHLLEKLARNYDLSRIKSIGGAAQHALVWWKSTTVPSLSSLDPRQPLAAHFTAHSFSLPNTPTAQDTSAHAHALAFEALLGGPDLMAQRVGTCAAPSLVAAQLLRVREQMHADVWMRTGRIQLASAFICSLLVGKWAPMNEAEACATGMFVHRERDRDKPGAPGGGGGWDEGVLDIVGASREEGRKVRGWLGEVDSSSGAKKVGQVSRYMVDRYGFDPDTIVAPFTVDFLASYLSVLPSPSDAVLSFGPMDLLLTPAPRYHTTRLYNLYPHPAQDPSERRKYIAVLHSRNADVARALVRDMYTKSWSAFDRLVEIVPPGGSIGLDDKLFSFWHLQGDSYPYSHVKGIFRFENGVKVSEFRDLRANPRCLLESQLLSFRIKWSAMADVLLNQPSSSSVTPGTPRTPKPIPANPAISPTSTTGGAERWYDSSNLPKRLITTGAAANFPSIAGIATDVFKAPVLLPASQVDGAQLVPHRNAPPTGHPGRGCVGAAYIARWVAHNPNTAGGFEEETRRVLRRRWTASGATWARTCVPTPTLATVTNLTAPVLGGRPFSALTGQLQLQLQQGSGSGASTPFGVVVVEEDEEEEEDDSANVAGAGSGSYTPQSQAATPNLGPQQHRSGGYSSGGMTPTTPNFAGQLPIGAGAPGASQQAPGSYFSHQHNQQQQQQQQSSSSPSLGGTGPTTPGGSATPATTSGGGGGGNALKAVTALRSTTEVEAQTGLARVAEPDSDAFLTYAAIVGEYCRLEGLVIKNIV